MEDWGAREPTLAELSDQWEQRNVSDEEYVAALRQQVEELGYERNEAKRLLGLAEAKLAKVAEALEADALFVDCEHCRRAIAAAKGE